MSQFLFVNGQIRALESKLLDVSKLDRMIGAKTPEDAFRVMAELQYSQYFDDTVTAKDFMKIIEQGLQETKDLLQKGSNQHRGLDFIFGRFDINNLKRAYKARVVDGETEISNFTEDNGYSTLGNLSEQEIGWIVFEKQMIDTLPESYLDALKDIEALHIADKNIQEIEYALDTAFIRNILNIAEQSRSPFLKELAILSVDMANIRVCARSILAQKKETPVQATINKGSFEGIDWNNIASVEALQGLIRSSELYKSADVLTEETHPIEQLDALEQSLDAFMADFLETNAQGEIDSIAVAIHYFELRLRDARRLKFIMFAKFNGFDSDTIYNALGTL